MRVDKSERARGRGGVRGDESERARGGEEVRS